MCSSKTPKAPGLSPEELALITKQGVTLDKLNEILSSDSALATQNQDLLRNLSGLYGADGKLDPDAVAALKERIKGQQGMENEILNSLAARFQGALAGTGAPGDALVNLEKEEFAKLKESAGQRGIRLEGDDLFTATSQSTAGNQLLDRLRRSAAGRRDAERNAIISQGFMGFGTPPEVALANEAVNLGPSRLAPSFLGLGGGYAGAAEPYQNQRYLQYQSALQGNANRQNAVSGLTGLAGGAAGAFIGNSIAPGYGAMLGFGLGSGAGRSLGGFF